MSVRNRVAAAAVAIGALGVAAPIAGAATSTGPVSVGMPAAPALPAGLQNGITGLQNSVTCVGNSITTAFKPATGGAPTAPTSIQDLQSGYQAGLQTMQSSWQATQGCFKAGIQGVLGQIPTPAAPGAGG